MRRFESEGRDVKDMNRVAAREKAAHERKCRARHWCRTCGARVDRDGDAIQPSRADQVAELREELARAERRIEQMERDLANHDGRKAGLAEAAAFCESRDSKEGREIARTLRGWL